MRLLTTVSIQRDYVKNGGTAEIMAEHIGLEPEYKSVRFSKVYL